MENHWDLISQTLAALSIGLLIGLEREFGQRKINGLAKHYEAAGIRTFTTVALLGNLSTWLPLPLGLWMPALAIIFISIMAILSYQRTNHDDSGFTSEIALVISCILGSLTGFGFTTEASMIAVITISLLHFKKWLHHFSHNLSKIDIRQSLLFLIITVIILPILPNQSYGPYEAFNPYRIWLMVVLISGIGFAAYAAIKILGSRAGLLLTGLLGGLASSTAVTLAMGRLSQSSTQLQAPCTLATLLACGTMFPRVLLLTFLFNPKLSELLAPAILAIVGFSLFITMILWYKSRQKPTQEGLYSPKKNPLSLRIALVFAAFYSLVVLLSHIGLAHFGQSGLLVVAALSGLSDVDAITLSLAEMTQSEEFLHLAAQGILLACAANSLIKLILSLSFAPKATHRWLMAGLIPMILLSLISFYLL
ncbi:MAG: MgtC/SapB family protein [Mariprofundaceae bacterium]